MSNSQLNKLKSRIKNNAEATLHFSSNVVSDSNDETNFPHKLLLTKTQVSRICIAFTNGPSTNIKFSKTRLFKMVQLGEFIDYLVDQFGLVISLTSKLQGKFISELTDSKGSFSNTRFNLLGKKEEPSLGSGITLTNNEIKVIIKLIRFLENRGIFLKGTIKKILAKKDGFSIFLGH